MPANYCFCRAGNSKDPLMAQRPASPPSNRK
ncbi:rCG24828 [Rattus norvegicus]|uniref:RCG24828 n=1 Tax=Rattus norvegicus TaxID=10116 RepID=A6JCL4_RAT|nr:rCG24828 [Rattus norvegicus]